MRKYIFKVPNNGSDGQKTVYLIRNGNFHCKYDKNSNFFKFDTFSRVPLNEKYYLTKLLLGYQTDITSPQIEKILRYVMHFNKNTYNSEDQPYESENKRIKETYNTYPLFTIEDKNHFKYTNVHEIPDNILAGMKQIQRPILALYIEGGPKMQRFLNLHNPYIIAYAGYAYISPHVCNDFIHPNFNLNAIDSMFIYSNIVEKTRVGSSLSNLLDIVTVDKTVINKQVPISVYKPLSKYNFSNASIYITDSFGEPISQPRNTFTGVEIHIKQRK